MIIEFFKLRDDVKTPTRANPSDAGLDIYYQPNFEEQEKYGIKGERFHMGTTLIDSTTRKDNASVWIYPNGNAMLPTGLKFGIPHGYMLQVCNRGSMGA